VEWNVKMILSVWGFFFILQELCLLLALQFVVGFVLLINSVPGICNNRHHAPVLYPNLTQIHSLCRNWLCIIWFCDFLCICHPFTTIYEGKSLNKRNFIITFLQEYLWKLFVSYFWTYSPCFATHLVQLSTSLRVSSIKKTFLECPLTTFSPPHYLVGICKFLAPQMFFHRSKKVKVWWRQVLIVW